MAARDCPTCRGMHLDGRLRCPSCGHSLGDILPVVPRPVAALHARFIAGRAPDRVALIPASIPFLLPFPVLALGWAGLALLRPGAEKEGRAKVDDWVPAIAVAIINIIVSVWLISSASREIVDLFLWLWGQVPSGPAPSAPSGGGVAV